MRGTHTKTPQGRSSECQRCTCIGCLAVRISFQCCSSSDPELFRPKESQPIISRPFLPIPPRRRLYTERKSVTSPSWNNAICYSETKYLRMEYHVSYCKRSETFVNPLTAKSIKYVSWRILFGKSLYIKFKTSFCPQIKYISKTVKTLI